MRLLVTGFGPFPRMPRNPSASLAAAVAGSPAWGRRGHGARCAILTTSYAALRTELAPVLADGPDAVLLIGVAGRSRVVRVERRGTSRRSTLFPDVDGTTARAPKGRAVARSTRANARSALLALRRHGVPARLSRDAGRYLCNAAYFLALAEPAPVLFIHVPVPVPTWRVRRVGARKRRLSRADALRDALVAVATTMLRDARVAGRCGLR